MFKAIAITHILVVDDDKGLLRLIEKLLRQEGFLVATASSGKEAQTWLNQNKPDLMLLDLKLSDLSGKELIGNLSKENKLPPFIIITGQGDERVAVEMMQLGAIDYLVKDTQFIGFVPTVVKKALQQIEKDKRLVLAEEQTMQLQKEILEISENERQRIGLDLHDGLGQQLTGLELLIQALTRQLKTASPELAKQSKEISQHIRQTITQTRLLSHNLSPVPLEEDGLMIALSELIAGVQNVSKIQCEFICPEPVLLPDKNVAMHFYRIAQEAVNNALKHSQAKKIVVTFIEHNNCWTMSIQDNGKGFSSNHHSGLGLRIMKYRAQLIGASFEIIAEPQKGTQIACVLPKIL